MMKAEKQGFYKIKDKLELVIGRQPDANMDSGFLGGNIAECKLGTIDDR